MFRMFFDEGGLSGVTCCGAIAGFWAFIMARGEGRFLYFWPTARMVSSRDRLFIILFCYIKYLLVLIISLKQNKKRINNFMHHLTNFYRHRCEQLEQQVKLLEAYVRTPEQIKRTAQGEGIQAGENEIYRLEDRRQAGEKISPEEGAYRISKAAESRMADINSRSEVRLRQIQSALNMIPVAARFGDIDAVHSLSRVLADIHGVSHEFGDSTPQDLRFFSMVHAGKYEPRRPQPEDFQSSETPADPDDFQEPRELDAEDARILRNTSQNIRLRGPEGGISRYFQ